MKDIKKYYLYGLYSSRSVGKIRYIGYATNLNKRLIEHLKDVNRISIKTYKKNWIKSELKNGFNINILLIDESNGLNEIKKKEINSIILFKSLGASLVNGTKGGDGVVCTEEVRKRMSLALKGKKRSFEANIKNSEALKDRKLSETHKLKISESLKGKCGQVRSEDTKAKISLALKGKPSGMKGKKLSEERRLFVGSLRKGVVSEKRVRINQFSKSGIFIKKWDCIYLAKKELNINNVDKALSGERNYAGGFIWKYN